jgi:hypothetical protein
LIRAADAEFDVPREPGRRYTRIECCRRETSERREYIDTVVVRNQRQRVVPERHVMATVDEDIEGELSQRLWIDDQVPRTCDSGPEIGSFFAVTIERAASDRAVVGLSGRGRRRTRRAHEDGECGDDVSQDIFSAFHNMIFFLCFGFVAVVPGNPGDAGRFPFLPESLRRVAKKVLELARRAPELRRRLGRSGVGSDRCRYRMITCNLFWALAPEHVETPIHRGF